VAGRAPADALAGEGLLAVKAELSYDGSYGEYQRLSPGDGAVLELDALDAPLEIELDRVLVDDLRAEALGLLLELRHQLRALDALGEPREVLDVRGGHERAAGIEGAGDHDRGHLGARGVDGGGVPGGPGADDHHLVHGVVMRRARRRAGLCGRGRAGEGVRGPGGRGRGGAA